ncbi:hypothetical protein DFH08DRAFT_822075 [Mycena albidolilacea]|uniref:Uncharacterized protein n=1 Tax=Mycena albidolilacea TaxID=1033008 RepID=A0AAD7ED18_9AGAR|nr:hypothetical protein DFH08DRAFT_822075 [Mycena albidolilacea]
MLRVCVPFEGVIITGGKSRCPDDEGPDEITELRVVAVQARLLRNNCELSTTTQIETMGSQAKSRELPTDQTTLNGVSNSHLGSHIGSPGASFALLFTHEPQSPPTCTLSRLKVSRLHCGFSSSGAATVTQHALGLIQKSSLFWTVANILWLPLANILWLPLAKIHGLQSAYSGEYLESISTDSASRKPENNHGKYKFFLDRTQQTTVAAVYGAAILP